MHVGQICVTSVRDVHEKTSRDCGELGEVGQGVDEARGIRQSDDTQVPAMDASHVVDTGGQIVVAVLPLK